MPTPRGPGLQPLAVTVGYGRNNSGHEFRIFESTGEDVFRLTADAIGTQWLTFRAEYELSGRDGSGLDEACWCRSASSRRCATTTLPIAAGTGSPGKSTSCPTNCGCSARRSVLGQDDYDDSYFGLQESTFRVFTLSADLQRPDGWRAGASYTYERYSGFQQSRNANPGQETDPLRDWTVDSRERVNYFSIYATPPRFRQNTEARVSYDFSYAEGSYFYAIPPGSPLTPPNQLPNVYNKLQQFHLDVRHKLTNQWVATVSYLYEPFRVYDFAFDPTVVDSIVQPSSLVLGYVYRPYTAHSFVVGAQVFLVTGYALFIPWRLHADHVHDEEDSSRGRSHARRRMAPSLAAAGQDAKRGAGSLYGAEVPGLSRHRWPRATRRTRSMASGRSSLGC